MAFLLDALGALRERYRALGGNLCVRRGDPAREPSRAVDEHGADRVVWNHDYSGLAAERDGRVVEALDGAGIPHDAYDDALLHQPGSITTNAGEHYSVFSYFWEKWRDRGKDDPCPTPDDVAAVDPDPIPTPADLGFDPPESDLPPAGPAAARDRLDAFCDGPIFDYAEDRDYPAREGTARLSPHLKFGTVGVRDVWAATADAAERASGGERDSVTEFRRQLAWREFYAHALAAEPRIVTENYREYENEIPWRDDPDAEYIRVYVPELRDVPPDEIHRWHELAPDRRAELAPGYPAPVVDHAERREDALAAFEAARGG